MLPLLMCLSLLAADPPPNAGPIRLPAVTVTADPKPMPGPDAVTRLTADRLFVLDSDVPVIVLSSPPGLVTLTEDVGPVKFRGQFADGTGKYETRTFAGKYVYTVEASKTGRVELIVVPVGAKTAGEVIRRLIDVAGDNPQPPQPGPALSALGKAVKDGIAASPEAERPLAGRLQAFYARAGELAADPAVTTWGGLFDAMAAAAKSAGVAGKLRPAQLAIQAALVAVLPSSKASDAPLDDAGRAKAVAAFAGVAEAIAEATK